MQVPDGVYYCYHNQCTYCPGVKAKLPDIAKLLGVPESRIVKVNVMENGEFANALSIQSVPQIVWKKDGLLHKLVVGQITSLDDVKAKIDRAKAQ